MKKAYIVLLIMLATAGLHARNNGITLRFSAKHTCTFAEIDSIVIENLTQGGSQVLYYPDTVITFTATDIRIVDGIHDALYVSQNYPNPFAGETNIDIYVPGSDLFYLEVYDLTGRQVTAYEKWLEQGMHQFAFYACNKQAYIFTVSSQMHVQKQLMIQLGTGGSAPSTLIYNGETLINKRMTQQAIAHQKSSSSSEFGFNIGDELRFTGYVTGGSGNKYHEIITDTPVADQDYLFDIANIQPAQPSEIAGDHTVAANEMGLEYEVASIQGVTYHWTVPGDWTITGGQGEHAITADAGVASGEISVVAENACGTSPERILAVTVHVTLTLVASPAEGGTVTGTGTYEEGAQVPVTATPAEGWAFVNWTGDTDYIDDPSAASATVTMPAQNVSLTANFEQEESGVVEVTNPTTGKIWMDRNLGASRAATSSDDAEAYGDLHQWGRAADGHQKRTAGTTDELSDSDTPGHGLFIMSPSNNPGDWRSPQNNDLWQGVNGVNNPCPPGYRLPTSAELDDERESWDSNNPAGAFASPLKLPAAGFRQWRAGDILTEGTEGHYWSSTVPDHRSRTLRFDSGAVIGFSLRANGLSVRCIKD